MSDRYRNWWPAGTAAPVMPMQRKAIEDQVLEDLQKAKSEAERLEILDSYFIYAQRVYRSRMIMAFADETGSLAVKVSSLFFQQLLPEIIPPYRPVKADPGGT